MSRQDLLAALLAERFGPLPVERTHPIPKVIPRDDVSRDVSRPELVAAAREPGRAP